MTFYKRSRALQPQINLQLLGTWSSGCWTSLLSCTHSLDPCGTCNNNESRTVHCCLHPTPVFFCRFPRFPPSTANVHLLAAFLVVLRYADFEIFKYIFIGHFGDFDQQMGDLTLGTTWCRRSPNQPTQRLDHHPTSLGPDDFSCPFLERTVHGDGCKQLPLYSRVFR